MKNIAEWLVLVSCATLFVGCSPSTNVSRQPSKEEIAQARQREATAVDERTDLTPDQKAGLKRYYQGGGQQGVPGHSSR